jgi:hypothetical protein
MLHDTRIDTAFRAPMLKAADACGTLARGGIDLRHGPGCERGALFVVEPRVLALNAFSEPAQPSSDGGVLFYSGYYAAAAPGLDLRWRFVAARDGYVVDDGRRREGVVIVSPRTPGADVERESGPWLLQMHALQYVYLGRTPTESAEGLLWVRDPALPPAVGNAVADAARAAWKAYAAGARVMPTESVAIVMLRATRTENGFTEYHGDRTEGGMLRLSFIDPPASPDAAQVARWGGFVAHEIAHLWNAGVFRSDHAEPWLHEGDADWASLLALHEAGLVTDAMLAGRLDEAINTCLATRGNRPAVKFPKSWEAQRDDPYACGLSLQLLGWTQMRLRDPASTASALDRWGELHRAAPMMDAAGFATFFDGGGAPHMRDLLLGDATPFASTYVRELERALPVEPILGELADPRLRERVSRRLGGLVVYSDCDAGGFSTLIEAGQIEIDPASHCASLPPGAHITRIAGEPAMARPQAAWQALRRACAQGTRVDIGFSDHAAMSLPCPKDVPEPPPAIRLPADALQRLNLVSRPLQAGTAEKNHV